MLYKLKYQRVIIIQQTLINADFNLYTCFCDFLRKQHHRH